MEKWHHNARKGRRIGKESRKKSEKLGRRGANAKNPLFYLESSTSSVVLVR